MPARATEMQKRARAGLRRHRARADGFILTNFSTWWPRPTKSKWLLSNGKKYKARVVGADPETDLAVLRVDAGTLPVIGFGN